MTVKGRIMKKQCWELYVMIVGQNGGGVKKKVSRHFMSIGYTFGESVVLYFLDSLSVIIHYIDITASNVVGSVYFYTFNITTAVEIYRSFFAVI